MITKGTLDEDGTSAQNPAGLYQCDSENILPKLEG
jgi:hypothetical protein